MPAGKSPGVLLGLSAVCVSGLFNPRAVEAQFASEKVSLYSQIDLATFGASSGNDCWGYTSPSGREYALMSVLNKLAFVEITNPAAPVWFASIPHPNSIWGDVKVYQDAAYAVTETGGTGIQVIDMSNIDSQVVTLVRTIPLPDTNHNIAVDTTSGYLYTCGSNGGSATTVIFNLSNPTDPLQVGTWSGAYEHDAQIITYQSGPYSGRQIMFGASEGRGLDVIDVTSKSNTFLVSRTPYPSVSYCHQLWTEDLQYVYINDELDSITRTTVFDISDLNNPVMVGEFSAGTGAIEHNNYVRDGFLYEANYHSGLRIFNTNCDPVNPPQVGWFDTYPADDGDGFDGAWSCYPFFPSGTVIVSDIDRGLFVLDVSEALAAEAMLFDYPNGRPALIDPAGGTTMQVNITGLCNAAPDPQTGLLHYDLGGGFITTPMQEGSPGQYQAVFPAATCPQEVPYYVSIESTSGGTLTSPSDAPASAFTATAAIGTTVRFADNFETDQGWIAENLGATSGDWQRGVPVDDPLWDYDPASDSDGSGQCYLTQNQLGNTDVDGGAVRLTSPLLDLSAGGLFFTYDYYLYLTNGDGTDRLLVEISANDLAGPWVEVARHDSSGGLSWRTQVITEQDLAAAGVAPTATMRLRYTANDGTPQSIVEAGLDAFALQAYDCTAPGTCSDGILNQNEELIDCGGVCLPCACTADPHCDDGAFCTGAETCDAYGVCQTGADPCQAGQYCRESDDACVAYGNGDFNIDGAVDLFDYARMQECFGAEAGPACEPGNLTGGAIIDLDDYDAFQQALTGPV